MGKISKLHEGPIGGFDDRPLDLDPSTPDFIEKFIEKMSIPVKDNKQKEDEDK